MIRARPDEAPEWAMAPAGKKTKVFHHSLHHNIPPPLHESAVNIAHASNRETEQCGLQAPSAMHVDEGEPTQGDVVHNSVMDVEACHEVSSIPPCHRGSFRSYVGLGGNVMESRWHAHT